MLSGVIDTVSGWSAAGGIVIFVTVSLIRGWLVPKNTHERELKASDTRAEEWKETALEGRETLSKALDANAIVDEYRRKEGKP